MGWRVSVARRKPSNKAAAWFQLVMRCQRSRMTTPSRGAETELSVRAISSASASRWAFSLRNKRYKLSNKSPQAPLLSGGSQSSGCCNNQLLMRASCQVLKLKYNSKATAVGHRLCWYQETNKLATSSKSMRRISWKIEKFIGKSQPET